MYAACIIMNEHVEVVYAKAVMDTNIGRNIELIIAILLPSRCASYGSPFLVVAAVPVSPEKSVSLLITTGLFPPPAAAAAPLLLLPLLLLLLLLLLPREPPFS